MPSCGSQIILCGLPIRFDTYSGCSHLCKYCFSQKKINLNEIRTCETVKALESFINGNRSKETSWCDWNIPLHWGGLSDPFQPLEAKYKLSYECLKLLAKSKYPFVVSTKGKLIVEEEYLSLLKECNCVVQISLVCPEYDKLEPGAPPFEERLEMIRLLSRNVQRVMVRIQPYMTEVHKSILQNLPRFKENGAYGIIVEGMKFLKKQPGLEKIGGDFAYPKNLLEQKYKEIRVKAHELGLKFYCGENRLRGLGDNLTCCGIDGLEGFKPNEYNLCHLINGAKAEPSQKMKEPNTAYCFQSMNQSAAGHKNLEGMSYNEKMLSEIKNKKQYYKGLFGK